VRHEKPTLAPTLTLPQSIGLAITLVVGSGLLALPGLAYQSAGASAIYAWAISAVISVPFLVVFAVLGSRLPGAGGVAGYVQNAFSRRATIPVEFLLLGTFVVGGPAMIITGGNYFAAALGLSDVAAGVGCAMVLTLSTSLNYLGAKISGRVQQIMAAALVLLLLGIALAALLFGARAGAGIAPVSDWAKGIPAVGLVFFAFVGWEMMSFTTEEFRNPRRDFPSMIAVSFVIVVVLYLLTAAAVQLVLPAGDRRLIDAPIAALLASTLGVTSGRVIAFIGLLMILANFTSGSWAASRLVFSSAREGLLPEVLSRVDPSKTPRNAVVVMALGYIPLVVLYFAGVVSQGRMFQLAGVNFFTLYALSVIAFIKIAQRWYAKLFGALAMLLVIIVMITFGVVMLYPIALLALGWGWVVLRRLPHAEGDA
jgi:amino acid efflux transporter